MYALRSFLSYMKTSRLELTRTNAREHLLIRMHAHRRVGMLQQLAAAAEGPPPGVGC